MSTTPTLLYDVWQWFPKDGETGTGRTRKSWSDTLTEDLQNTEMIWTDYGEIADDWSLWKTCVAQCVLRARGRTKV